MNEVQPPLYRDEFFTLGLSGKQSRGRLLIEDREFHNNPYFLNLTKEEILHLLMLEHKIPMRTSGPMAYLHPDYIYTIDHSILTRATSVEWKPAYE